MKSGCTQCTWHFEFHGVIDLLAIFSLLFVVPIACSSNLDICARSKDRSDWIESINIGIVNTSSPWTWMYTSMI